MKQNGYWELPEDMTNAEYDIPCLRAAVEAARRARQKGNHPYGAVLADENGKIVLEAENTVVTSHDCTAHAETNLMRAASAQFERDSLARFTVYTSTEPCPMCAGAIFWGNVRRVVYGLSEERLYRLVGGESKEVLYLPCREIFSRGKKPIEVIGPLLEEEAEDVHLGYWGR